MDKILDYNELGHAFEFHAPTEFYFQLDNILRSYLNLLTSYCRLTDLKTLLGLLLVGFIWLEEKISLKCLLSGGWTFVQTG